MTIRENRPSLYFESILVQKSPDLMTGYLTLRRPEGEASGPVKEQMMAALKEEKIIFGIRETIIEKLGEKPVYDLKFEVARGISAIRGKDGEVIDHIKKDKDYQPEYNEEGTVDYKNVSYFQLAKKDQVLCTIIPAEKGTSGINIFAQKITAVDGKDPFLPIGKNTTLSEDENEIIAQKDGLIKYEGNRIDISEMLHLRTNVDILSGNIDFTGDVTIDGDVCSGFCVKASGNIIIKGVVEDADVKAKGSIHIVKGINGIGKDLISAGGDLTCKYIENAVVSVDGSIHTDYIIDSRVLCNGNIELNGNQEVLFGGEIRLKGDLKVRELGNQGERPTRIEVMGIQVIDRDKIKALKLEKDHSAQTVKLLVENAGNIVKVIDRGQVSSAMAGQLKQLLQQVSLLEKKLAWIDAEIGRAENSESILFGGIITCKRKMFPGVKVYFGEQRFKSEDHELGYCKIYCHNEEIQQGTL